ncbi:MAG: FeoA family protein [Marmoricola sp.]
MSLLNAHLDDRTVTAAHVDGVVPTTLAELGVGEEGVVAGFDDGLDPAMVRRFFDLGFAVGAPVRVVRRAPLRDPVVFAVADYEIALRGRQAAAIRIRRER